MDLYWTKKYIVYITQYQASYTSSQKTVGYYSNEFKIK